MKTVLGKGVQVCSDDDLGYASTEAQLLDILSVVLQRCNTYGVKLNPEKWHIQQYGMGRKFQGRG